MLCVLGGGAMPSGMSTLSRPETTSGACACSTAAAAPHCGQAACIRHQHHIIPPPPHPPTAQEGHHGGEGSCLRPWRRPRANASGS